MKKYLLITLTFLAVQLLDAQSPTAYQQAMDKALAAMTGASEWEARKAAANHWERIAAQAEDQWHPAYYAAYMYTMINFELEKGDEKDEYLDIAQEWLDHALKLQPEEDELYALQGMIYLGRITVNPMFRGMSYSNKIESVIDKTLTLDPENPRAPYILGLLYEGMPSFAGGGKERACEHFRQAKTKFEAFEPEGPYAPDWGENSLEAKLGQCE